MYLAGLAALAAAGFLTSEPLTFVGLVLVAVGTGGVQPNVGVFGADQLVGCDERVSTSFWLLWYASINGGASLSYVVTPLIRETGGYGWAFVASLATMVTSVVLFVIPSRAYVHVPPTGVSVYAATASVLFTAAAALERAGAATWGQCGRPRTGGCSGGGGGEGGGGDGEGGGARGGRGRWRRAGVARAHAPHERCARVCGGPHDASACRRGQGCSGRDGVRREPPHAPAPHCRARVFRRVCCQRDPAALQRRRWYGRGGDDDEAAWLRGVGGGGSGGGGGGAGAAAMQLQQQQQQPVKLPPPSLEALLLWGPLGCGPCVPRGCPCCRTGTRARRERRRWGPEYARGLLPDAPRWTARSCFSPSFRSLRACRSSGRCTTRRVSSQLAPVCFVGAARRARDYRVVALRAVLRLTRRSTALCCARVPLRTPADSIWQVQRKTMDLCLTRSFCITPEQLGVVNPVLCMLFVPTLDRLVIPALYATGVSALRPTALRRMWCVHACGASSRSRLYVRVRAALCVRQTPVPTRARV